MREYKIIVIGAGAAGIGVATTIKHFGFKNEDFCVIERGEIGESFLNWPEETRFITPSFTTNGFGFVDINAVIPDTSPAYTFEKEHLSGKEYAKYLQMGAEYYELPIMENTEVLSIEKTSDDKYVLKTNNEDFEAKYIIVATGEFQNPNKSIIKGYEYAIHYGEVSSFSDFKDGEYCVIGGNESGVDALVNLVENSNKVNLFTNSFGPNEDNPDPSVSLSPITKTRLYNLNKEKYNVHEGKKLIEIVKLDDGYNLIFDDNTNYFTKNKPILSTGFNPCVHEIKGDIFEYNNEGLPIVSIEDESTIAENIFLVGPSLRQNNIIFCYIYKFRQRFATTIMEIAQREGITIDNQIIDLYRRNQMLLDDLSCCDVSCNC
ncbi:NAD(P)/FAD-dependent oxidoreductase [Helcococcus kunzii]|uniref:NAD(P)/FAD-dependent oxidoreductase n=1 Tax=Helcococcus kunzii TaxID=40091 RepID=UPI0021A67042|nr:NAD(P)/FAD-dependent oxidoreductase [Helcococcus kunzii]MCT1796051.1 NAD(P)-binding domain-containing protein [Helcococcus kunzii]MCT1988608.1 NAD(P)-binding domain-containing protein [Helcococcus kunzii]